MTNQQLLQRAQVLNVAMNEFQTITARSACMKNLKKIQGELETYQDLLKELLNDHDVELSKQGELPDNPPQEFSEDLQELLQSDGGDVDIVTLSPATLEKEDEKDTNISNELLIGLDWMIE